MNCPGCRARNPIGNKFCRECGQKLPLEENTLAQEEAQKAEAERAREQAAQLLTRAFTLSQQGKPAEALPLAEEAAALLPASTSALTLCSTLYERLGQNDKAITMMERVVALNPESLVDVDKLDRLRRGVHMLPVRPTVSSALATENDEGNERRRWLPVAIAVGTGAVVLFGGIFALSRLQRKEPGPLAVQEVTGGASTTNQGFFPQTPSATPPPQLSAGPLSAPALAPRNDPFAPLGGRPMSATPAPLGNPGALPNPAFSASGPRAGRPTGGGSLLPDPRQQPAGNGNEGPTTLGSGVPPVVLSGSSQNGGGVARPGQLPPLGGVQRNTDPIPAGPPTAPVPASPPTGSSNGGNESGESAGSFIRVREHPGNGNSSSSGESQTATRGGDPLGRAQSLQSSGRYREAIVAYREALAAGAAAAEVQQGIALCHQRLGEKAPARSAYQQAITAFEAQVRAGRRIEQATRGIAACRAALDVLGSS